MDRESLFHAMPPLPGRAIWKPRTGALEHTSRPKLSAASGPLHEFLSEVTGRYLHCISDATADAIPFAYDVREDSPGFLKLDVLYEMMVVGVDGRNGPVNRMLNAVNRAYFLETLRPEADSLAGFVPIVVFGERPPFLFYVESLRGFARVAPFFISAAQHFLASRIVPGYLGSDMAKLREYVEVMAREGKDPEQLVDRQPLFSTILSGVPQASRTEMLKQIGADIEVRLLQT